MSRIFAFCKITVLSALGFLSHIGGSSAQTTSCTSTLSKITTPSLNLTAISASNGNSIIECWQLPGFVTSAQAGTSGALNLFLGDLTNATYTVIPPRFNGGLHNAPAPQYVAFLSGLAHVTTANNTDEAWIQGGKYGIIVAVDNAAVSKYGHITTYPSDASTTVLQIPFKHGVSPNHTTLHRGPCTWEEMSGI